MSPIWLALMSPSLSWTAVTIMDNTKPFTP